MVISCFAHIVPLHAPIQCRETDLALDVFQAGFEKYCRLIEFVPHCSYVTFCHVLIHYRYELMSECWNEDPSSRPSFSEMIDRLEVIMTRDVPYCDLNKHDESRPYYNVRPKAEGHSG